jgi:exonuclease III
MTNVITVMSYNIWFDRKLALDRTLSLCNFINKNKVGIICLQEVTPEIYEILIMLLQDYRYHFPKKIKGYGCVTFSKYPITKCLDFPYTNSKMGRSLVITKIDYPYHLVNEDGNTVENVEIVIANSHFESIFNKNTENEIKIKQYQMANEILESMYNNYKNIIFCSDTNVMQHEDDTFSNIFYTKNEWTDAWIKKGSEINKFTYDSENNLYLKTRFNKKIRSRIDRILSKSNNCTVQEFNIIKGDIENLEPSDHFGIYAKFSIVK